MEEVFYPTVFLRYRRALRGILIDNQPGLVAHDLDCLVHERVEHYVINRLDEDLRRQVRLITSSGEETVWVINDFGAFHVLYHNPEHRELRQCLTNEVLPALRDQALLAADSPRCLLAKGEGKPMTLLDLWITLTQMPQMMREERHCARG